MIDRYYSPCQRCGAWPAGKYAHVIAASQRLICGSCWDQLKFDVSGRKVDDGRTPQLSTPARDVDNRTSG